MPISEQEFDLALLQIQELAGLYGKDSTIVRAAQYFNIQRKACKKQIQLFFRRLFRQPAAKPADRLKILIHVRGGIGDVCMTRLLVARLLAFLPQSCIDICYDHEETVAMVFSDGFINKYVSNTYDPHDYDVVMSGCHAFNFDYADMLRLQQLAPEWLPAFKQAQALQQKLQVVINNTPHLDGLWAHISMAYGSNRIKNMALTTGIAVEQNDRVPLQLEVAKLDKTLEELGLKNVRYITIHDGTNTNTDLHGRAATRCWPRAHWEQFARLFKRQFPDIKIVQLGASNSIPFDFADVCLVGKTEIAQLPYILEGALLHVDGESGMTQLANLTHTQAVVLFGPTPVKYFGYDRNINLQAGHCRGCMCIIKDWMSQCALFEMNRCLHSITPEMVFKAVEKTLK